MPYSSSWLGFEEASGGRTVLHGGVADIRKQYDDLVAALLPNAPPFPENVEFKETSADGVKVRVYNPKGATGSLPIGIWTHGGGYMVGDLNSDHILCGMVSGFANLVVVNVDYSLTPEAKWPTQLNESLTAYKWAHKNAASIGGDANKMFTVGGSAGGGLALQTANAVTKDSSLKSSLKGVCAMVPMTVSPKNVPAKYKGQYKAYEENAKGVPVIDSEVMYTFIEHLGADPQDKSAWTLLDSENHKNFPPVYFTSCEYDPLRDDTTVMLEALKEAGVPVKHDYYPGFPHYFWIFPGIPEAQGYIEKMVGGIGWFLSM